MTSAIPVQRSTNWANKPTRSWSMNWVLINIQVNDDFKYCIIANSWRLITIFHTIFRAFHSLNKNTKVIFYSFWNAEQNPIVAQSKYYVYTFLMLRRKNLQNCMNFPSYKETASFFCCGVFQPPQQECRWYI